MIRLLSIDELADELKIPEKVLALLVVEGRIPHRMVAGWPLFDPTNLGPVVAELTRRLKWEEKENQT
jgi:hypothetical protein